MHYDIFETRTGWVATEGVDKAYGEGKKYLEPLRTLYEGSEGIAWLCAAPADQIENGAYYLDRSPQVKHMAGPFFTEGSFTKNTPEEVAEMMAKLQQWSSGQRPTLQEAQAAAALRKPMVATSVPIDLASFMGDWYVLAHIPTMGEVGATNCIEHYDLDSTRANSVKVLFTYSFPGTGAAASSGETGTAAGSNEPPPFSTSQMKMKGTVKNAPTNTFWAIDPKVLGMPIPLGLSYLILDTAEDYSYTVVGVPDRSYLWIMVRNIPSEFTTSGVSVLDAYPEIQLPTRSDASAGSSVDADLPAYSGTSGVKKEASGSDSASSTGTSAAQLDAATQVKWRDFEVTVLKKACAKAAELGYDVDKILRCPWSNQIGRGNISSGAK